jgi:hypothetical protein
MTYCPFKLHFGFSYDNKWKEESSRLSKRAIRRKEAERKKGLRK